MIHEILRLERPLFILDVESTSLDVQAARIVEIAFQRWEASGLTKEWSTRLNPGIPIPPDVTRVHGISDADVIDRPAFKQIAVNLAQGFSDCDFGGQSVRYDLQIVAAEMARAGVTWSYLGARIVDSLQLERLAEPRSLSHLHKKYVGQEHDNAHGALSDIRAATTVIVHQLQTHPQLPRNLDALHKAQWPDEWLSGGGEFKLVKGVPTCCFGKYRGLAMKDVPVDYWDWILRSTFPPDVKALVTDAKRGKFVESRD